IEIKKYPKLTTVGATRNGTIVGNYPGTANTNRKHSGYYTQAQVKEIVRYAAARFITVVPEIEMPGHASAAIAAYPALSCFPNEPTKIQHPNVWKGNTKGKQVQQTWGVFEDVLAPTDATFKFLQDVLDEVMALFPSKYIHIGGDECPKENWKRSTFCQQLIKSKGLKDEHELQSYFIQRIEKHVNAKGRTIIGWDEILEGGLAPNAIVMSWRGEEGGIEAAKQNHQVIMTPGGWCYFDHSQSLNEDSVTIGGFTPIEKVYSYEPVPAALNETQSQLILGAQANVWTEYITNESKLAYMVFPRMAALSEVLWSPKAQRNWPHFEQRLTQQFQRYKLWKINYSKAYFELNDSISVTSDGLLWHLLPPKGKHNIQFSLLPQGNAKPNFQPYTVPLLINQSYNLQAINTADGKPYPGITRNFNINKATGRAIQILRKPSKSYPGKYGALTLVDGLTANGKRNHPEWMGFSGGSVEIVIDFGEPVTISKLGVSTLHHPTSWVHAPSNISWEASLTANDWQPLQPTTHNEQGTVITIAPQQLQYLKIKLSAVDTIPAGLPGAGKPAWLFLDEIFAD
ncbi:MAG: beta-N-acetylhexosaminidase, partial [Chitinophagaceae bacterium]